ncbi:MAG: hypothetical protein ABI564_08610 [Ideonella sp.]
MAITLPRLADAADRNTWASSRKGSRGDVKSLGGADSTIAGCSRGAATGSATGTNVIDGLGEGAGLASEILATAECAGLRGRFGASTGEACRG